MKLVKAIATNSYLIISDLELSTNPSLYIDRTSQPLYWLNYGLDLCDMIATKYIINQLYLTNGWSSFKSKDEKKAVANILPYNVLTQIELDEVMTPIEQSNAKLVYLSKAKTSRINRWEYLRGQLALKLNTVDSIDLYNSTVLYKSDYEDIGHPNLQMWLTNGVYPALGIDFSTNGFAQKTYFNASLLQNVNDYFINGKQFETK